MPRHRKIPGRTSARNRTAPLCRNVARLATSTASGMFLTAATMLRRLTLNAEPATVATVMTMPRQYETTMVLGAKWMVRLKLSSKEANTRLMTKIITALTASPRPTPTAADTSA